MTNSPPTVWTVTTTRSTVASMAEYKTARRAVMRSVRRRWPNAECATLIEFQSGTGTRSGGKRRPHWNDLWKGIPVDDAAELRAVMDAAWCSRIDGLPRGQHVGTVQEVGGLMRYLALHFQKESQQPPKGWRGHRFTQSRGYLAVPMEHARAEAREALHLRREIWKVTQETVDTPEGEQPLLALLDTPELDALAQSRHDRRQALTWRLTRVVQLPTHFDDEGQPTGFGAALLPV